MLAHMEHPCPDCGHPGRSHDVTGCNHSKGHDVFGNPLRCGCLKTKTQIAAYYRTTGQP